MVKRARLLDLDNTTLLGVLLIAADKLGDRAYPASTLVAKPHPLPRLLLPGSGVGQNQSGAGAQS